MKKLLMSSIVTLLLVSTAAAQSAYIEQTNKAGVVSLKNVSGQPIVMIVGTILLDGKPTGTNNYTRDFFFKTPGFLNGDVTEDDTNYAPNQPVQSYNIKVTYLQFEDGSEWGDKKTAQDAFAKRAASLAYLQNLTAASDTQANFLAVLNRPQEPGPNEAATQRHYPTILREVGTPTTIAYVKERLAAATSRMKILAP
jgi:hypothetical protein